MLALGRFDPEDVAARFVSWMKTGPRDIGCTILGALARIASGRSWIDAGKIGFFETGESLSNGSLMRNGIMGFIPTDLHSAFAVTAKQCIITHYSPLPVLCCCAQTYIIRLLLDGIEFPRRWQEGFRGEWRAWITAERDPIILDWVTTVGDGLGAAWREFMDADFDPDSFDPFRERYEGRSGYCLLTLQIAVWALHRAVMKETPGHPADYPAEVFERRGPWTLGWVAMLGYDADSYGATAGPMLSARFGGLPDELTGSLMVHDWMQR